MYAPNYSFGQGNNTQSFNPNGGGHPQASQNVLQPGQQTQHMMYNTQQYGPGGHQSSYGTPSPGMGSNAGGMGMMQNSGLAHMPGGNGKLHILTILLYIFIAAAYFVHTSMFGWKTTQCLCYRL